MVESADVNELLELGLTRYEAKGYLALIGREHGTPAEIAQLAGIPRQRVYDVLSGLSERGLVSTVVGGKGLRYRAQPPDQVMDRLLSVRQRELDRLATSTRELAERLLPRFTDGQQHDTPLDYIEVLRDPRHAVQRVEELWAKAEHEVLTFVSPPYLAPPAPEEATTPPVVVTRAIYQTSLLDDPQMVDLVRAYAALGEEIRFVASLPLKLTVVDGHAAAFNMPDPVEDGSSVTTLVVHHEALANTLKIAFEATWSQASPLEEALSGRGV